MTQRLPRVSIGLPVYNGERYLREALDSILSQTFRDFELIVSDNASTDRTEDICREYAARDPRIRYHRNHENLGGSANFIRVFELARAPYFRWACYDDLLEPDSVAACVEVLDADPDVVLALTETILIDEHGEPIANPPRAHHPPGAFHLRAPRPHQRFADYLARYYPRGGLCNALYGVIRSEALARTRLIAPYPSSDRVLLGELVLYGHFHEVQRPLFLRRDHPQTSVRAHPEMADRVGWFDPARRGQLVFPRWRWLREYLSAIWRAPLGIAERLRCYAMLVNGYVRHARRPLWAEARAAARIWRERRTRRIRLSGAT
jgi:glycosyltransferase involved in cell wall biosynthesis